MKLNEEFIPYIEAIAMKELGFDEECLAFYNDDGYLHDWIGDDESKYPGDIRFDSYINSEIDDDVAAPTWRAMTKWFRDVHKLDSYVRQFTYIDNPDFGKFYFRIEQMELVNKDEDLKDYSSFENTYEEAELACLRKLIELVKSN